MNEEAIAVYEHILQGVEEADRGEFVSPEELEAFFAEFGVTTDKPQEK